jgi:hypothetical protein
MGRDGDPERAQQSFEVALDELEPRQEEGDQENLNRVIQADRNRPEDAGEAGCLGDLPQGSGQDGTQDGPEIGGEGAGEGRRCGRP